MFSRRERFAVGRRANKKKQTKPVSLKQAESNLSDVVTKDHKTVSYLRKVIKATERYNDNTFAGNATATSGNMNILNGLILGDTNGQRDGTSITMTKLEMRGHIYANATSNVAHVRFIILYDKQNNGATPVTNDFLQSTDPDAFRNINNISRFKVLYDKSFVVSTYEPKKLVKTINLKGKKTNYNTSNGGNAGDIVTGGLWCIYLSDLAANYPTIDLHCRLWYNM